MRRGRVRDSSAVSLATVRNRKNRRVSLLRRVRLARGASAIEKCRDRAGGFPRNDWCSRLPLRPRHIVRATPEDRLCPAGSNGLSASSPSSSSPSARATGGSSSRARRRRTSRRQTIDIARVRAMADELAGPKATEVRVETVAAMSFPGDRGGRGGGMGRVPDGRLFLPARLPRPDDRHRHRARREGRARPSAARSMPTPMRGWTPRWRTPRRSSSPTSIPIISAASWPIPIPISCAAGCS